MTSRILIVDDNQINLKLACDLLAIEGHEIERANNAEEALALISKTEFDLVLTDIELPGMDGLMLTRVIKGNPTTQDLTVVALTAFAMKGDDEKAFQAGCSGYITKPIDTRQFPTQIAQYLKKPVASGQVAQ